MCQALQWKQPVPSSPRAAEYCRAGRLDCVDATCFDWRLRRRLALRSCRIRLEPSNLRRKTGSKQGTPTSHGHGRIHQSTGIIKIIITNTIANHAEIVLQLDVLVRLCRVLSPNWAQYVRRPSFPQTTTSEQDDSKLCMQQATKRSQLFRKSV